MFILIDKLGIFTKINQKIKIKINLLKISKKIRIFNLTPYACISRVKI
jgi:hypothetical protein